MGEGVEFVLERLLLQSRANRVYHLILGERLDDKIRGTQIHGQAHSFRLDRRRNDNDRDGPGLFVVVQGTNQIEAVEARRGDIGQNDVGTARRDLGAQQL